MAQVKKNTFSWKHYLYKICHWWNQSMHYIARHHAPYYDTTWEAAVSGSLEDRAYTSKTIIIIYLSCNEPQGKLTAWVHFLINFGWTKKNLLEQDLNLRPPDWRAGALPTELTCPILYWRSPYFVNIFVRGAPVRSHETIYCPLARDHAQVTIQPGKMQYRDAP